MEGVFEYFMQYIKGEFKNYVKFCIILNRKDQKIFSELFSCTKVQLVNILLSKRREHNV